MADYTVTTSTDEESALQWVASQTDPPEDAATYFNKRMHEVLNDYVKQHNMQTAVAPVDDVAVAYATASTAQQTQVANILTVPLTQAP